MVFEADTVFLNRIFILFYWVFLCLNRVFLGGWIWIFIGVFLGGFRWGFILLPQGLTFTLFFGWFSH